MIHSLALFLICMVGWMHLFPDEAVGVLHELKRQLRRRMLQRLALDSAKELAQSLHARAARQGIDAHTVDRFLAEEQPAILADLERMYNGQIFSDRDRMA
jgi:hypothetical protein